MKITAGRFHTSLGYYNTAYPQGGAVYLLPIDRPCGRRSARQRVDRSDLDRRPQLPRQAPVLQQRFSYDLDVSNGRGIQSDDLANGGDANNPKMLNLRLRYEINGLHPGRKRDGRLDPARVVGIDPATDQPNTLREQIFGAHIAYVEHPWHIIAEGYHISHIGPNQTQRTLAGLAELGYTIGQMTPYARYEFARFPSPPDVLGADPPAGARQTQRRQHRHQDHPQRELRREDRAQWNHSQIDTEYRAATQVAFGF